MSYIPLEHLERCGRVILGEDGVVFSSYREALVESRLEVTGKFGPLVR